MDMKRYEFRDGRRLFRWLYITLLFNAAATSILLINRTSYDGEFPYAMILIALIAIFIIYKKTRTRIYLGDENLKIKEYVIFKKVTKINVTSDIEIITNSEKEIIKLIDLDRNYDEYKEMLKYILEKVNEDIRLNAGSEDELLQRAKVNIKSQYKERQSNNGKVELGGWLQFFYVMACVIVIFGLITVVSTLVAFSAMEFERSSVTMIIQSLINVSASIWFLALMNKRKNSAKYALAAQPLVSVVITLYNSINNIISGTGYTYILLVAAGVIISIISSLLMAKIYIEYIDTFERPKQTLIN